MPCTWPPNFLGGTTFWQVGASAPSPLNETLPSFSTYTSSPKPLTSMQQSSGAGPAAPVGTTQQELDTLRRENQQLQIQKQDLLGRLQNGGIKEVDHAVEVSVCKLVDLLLVVCLCGPPTV